MAQNFEQESIDALTKYTTNLVSDHRVYMEESTLHAKKNGYRPKKTLTSADKRRTQHTKVHYETVPWDDLTHGEEISVFTATINGSRLWKRFGNEGQYVSALSGSFLLDQGSRDALVTPRRRYEESLYQDAALGEQGDLLNTTREWGLHNHWRGVEPEIFSSSPASRCAGLEQRVRLWIANDEAGLLDTCSNFRPSTVEGVGHGYDLSGRSPNAREALCSLYPRLPSPS